MIENSKLYDADKLEATSDEIAAMAERFGVAKEDVVRASWLISRDMVWARLKRDLEDLRDEKNRRR